MDDNEAAVEKIALEIERYLRANHEAADSAEGIRHWWLPPSLRNMPLELVVAALKVLETRGVVEKRRLEGAGDIYAKGAWLGNNMAH